MFASSEGFFFFFLTEHNLYKFAHNEVSSIYTLICSLNPRLTLLTIKTGLTEVLNQVWCFFAAVLQLKSLLNPGRYFGFREYSLKTFIAISEERRTPKSYGKTGNKKLATCLATLLQKDLNSDATRFTTHEWIPCTLNGCKTGSNVGSKTCNIAIKLILQEFCPLHSTAKNWPFC